MFLNIKLPDNISFGATGGPAYQTDVVILASGYEQRNSRWTDSRRKYDIGYVKSQVEADQLAAFFHAVKGRANSFRFKDHADYICINGDLQAVDDDGFEWQMFKVYESYGNYTYRKITKPVFDTAKIYEGSSEITTGFVIDYSTGIVTFDSARTSSDQLSWDGEFDVPCRFDTDELQATILESSVNDRLYQLNNVSVIEVRE
jgi:uncharacterized protein (TIGR02217 family)